MTLNGMHSCPLKRCAISMAFSALFLVAHARALAGADIPAMPACDESVDYVKKIEMWKKANLPESEITEYPCRPEWRALCNRLSRLRKADQAVRKAPIDPMKMREVDDNNFRELKEILRAHGVPDRRRIGTRAAETFHILVMHAPDLEFQRAMLPRMEEAAAQGKIRAERAAYLEDRIRDALGRPLRFGTQFSCNPKTGKLEPRPVEDVERLDERRRQYGLYPFGLYACALKHEMRHACDAYAPARNRP